MNRLSETSVILRSEPKGEERVFSSLVRFGRLQGIESVERVHDVIVGWRRRAENALRMLALANGRRAESSAWSEDPRYRTRTKTRTSCSRVCVRSLSQSSQYQFLRGVPSGIP